MVDPEIHRLLLINYIESKAVFRRAHRRTCDKYLISLNNEIDRAAEVDSATFWKIIKMPRAKKGNSIGNEMKFNDVIYRDSTSITREWGLYFKELYTPSDNTNYDSDFYDFLTKHMNDINATVF